MKKIIASITMLAAGAALASTVTSAQTFGVLKVTSTTAETAICVPWVAAGTGNDIKVKDFVKTTDLTIGDELYLYETNTETFASWILTEDKSTTPWTTNWTGTASIRDLGKVVAAGDDDTMIGRGSALILRRQHPETGAFYLYGQYTDSTLGVITLAKRKQTLFAPPNVSGASINLNECEWNDVESADFIYVQNETTGNRTKITRNTKNTVTKADGSGPETVSVGSCWVCATISGESKALAVIQPGQGAWYVSNAEASSDPTVTFP